MKKIVVVLMSICIGFLLFSFTQRTNEKKLIMVRIYESCKGTGGVAKIIVNGDGAEKITPLELYPIKSPESTTNLELIRYTLRTYFEDGYKTSAFTSITSGYQEITTYVLTKE